jgi:hypothetical protein
VVLLKNVRGGIGGFALPPCVSTVRSACRFAIGRVNSSASPDWVEVTISLFAAACCGCNPAAAAASTVFFSLWIAAAAIQTAATVSACSQPNTAHGSSGGCCLL